MAAYLGTFQNILAGETVRIETPITNEESGDSVDLSSASVKFAYWKEGQSSVVVDPTIDGSIVSVVLLPSTTVAMLGDYKWAFQIRIDGVNERVVGGLLRVEAGGAGAIEPD